MRRLGFRKWVIVLTVAGVSIFWSDGGTARAATSTEDSALLAVIKQAFEDGDDTVNLTLPSDQLKSNQAAENEARELCVLVEEAALDNGKVMTAFRYRYVIPEGSKSIVYTFDISDENTNKVTKLSSEKKAYQQALKALKNRNYTSAFYSKGNKYYDIFVLCLEQHPEYNYGLTIWKSANGTCGYRPSGSLTSSEIASLMKKTNSKVNAIAKKIFKSGMSNKQKLQAIHDYLVKNCAYDEKKINLDGYDNGYTAYGCLVEKSAVCQGYTAAFNLLAKKAGITSIAVSGTANGGYHGWNMMKVGSIVYVDVTWDDPLPDQGSKAKVRQTYFYLTQSAISKDHSWDKTDYSKKYLTYSML